MLIDITLRRNLCKLFTAFVFKRLGFFVDFTLKVGETSTVKILARIPEVLLLLFNFCWGSSETTAEVRSCDFGAAC